MSKTPEMFSGQQRVVVDWDGTCVEQVWPEHGDWLPGAVEALHAFLNAGLEVYIYTTRLAPRQIDEVTQVKRTDRERERRIIREQLDAAGLEDVHIWRRPWKPGALAYVDDKAVRFNGDWMEVVGAVLTTAVVA